MRENLWSLQTQALGTIPSTRAAASLFAQLRPRCTPRPPASPFPAQDSAWPCSILLPAPVQRWGHPGINGGPGSRLSPDLLRITAPSPPPPTHRAQGIGVQSEMSREL